MVRKSGKGLREGQMMREREMEIERETRGVGEVSSYNFGR